MWYHACAKKRLHLRLLVGSGGTASVTLLCHSCAFHVSGESGVRVKEQSGLLSFRFRRVVTMSAPKQDEGENFLEGQVSSAGRQKADGLSG